MTETAQRKDGCVLVVLDLETTGTRAKADDILEVGAIVIDANLQAVRGSRFSRLCPRHKAFHDIDPYVREMHMRSGLWAAIDNAQQHNALNHIGAVDWALSEHLAAFGVQPGKGILVGNSIDFDRRFIRADMPATENLLHYRMRDLSALSKQLGEWGVEFKTPANPTHRALRDCEDELEHLQDIERAIRDLVCRARLSEGMAIP